jgi:hypothetical protein
MVNELGYPRIDSFKQHREFSTKALALVFMLLLVIAMFELTQREGLPEIKEVTEYDIRKAERAFSSTVTSN